MEAAFLLTAVAEPAADNSGDSGVGNPPESQAERPGRRPGRAEEAEEAEEAEVDLGVASRLRSNILFKPCVWTRRRATPSGT